MSTSPECEKCRANMEVCATLLQGVQAMNIFAAAARGDLECIESVVDQNARSLHAIDDSGWTPLFHAAFGRHVEVALYLLEHGAPISHRDRLQRTGLHLACLSGDAVVVWLFLRSGTNPRAVDISGRTPLMNAAGGGRAAVVHVLLEHGGSKGDATNHYGWTACHCACHGGRSGVLKQLLEAGADPRVRDARGRAAMDLAVPWGYDDCIRVCEAWDRACLLQTVRRLRDEPWRSSSSTLQQGS